MANDNLSLAETTERILAQTDLSPKEFSYISNLVYQISGIQLPRGKEGLVKTRLSRHMRTLGATSFEEYIHLLENDVQKKEMSYMIDLLTTNKTDFFREMPHFHFLSKKIFPDWKQRKRLRIWSAGCSSGEEPFSYAIHISEEVGDMAAKDIKILATDLSMRVLTKARQAVYEPDRIADIPPALLKTYFTQINGVNGPSYQVCKKLRLQISFAQLNLMESWPMKGPFDLISCRNVMIYFDKPTVERLINRYAALLAPRAYLFVGHSESLSSIKHDLIYLQPAVYQKPA
jgi:chemotaxis protein methyltransferase CheR